MDRETALGAGAEHSSRRDLSTGEAARAHGFTVAEIEQETGMFLAAAENTVRTGAQRRRGNKGQAYPAVLERKIGEMVLDMNVMREAFKIRPSDDGMFDE